MQSGLPAPLASAWRDAPEATALLAWSDGALAALSTQLDLVWRHWQAQWGLATRGAAVCLPAPEAGPIPAASWQAWGDPICGAWVADPQSIAPSLHAALWQTPQRTGELARELAEAAWQAARLALAEALQLAPGLHATAPPEPLWQPWSGAVVLRLPLGGQAVTLVLAAPCVRASMSAQPSDCGASVRARAPLVSLRDAAARRRVALQARLDGCSLTVGGLQSLQPGDLIRLDHRLDQPLRVSDATGQLVCHGWLGRSGVHKALELTTAPV